MRDEKTKCTGCGACEAVCEQNAISMVADNEGFAYPIIDSAKCIQCGKCQDICPDSQGPVAARGFAFRNNEKNVLQKSASGGAFTAIVSVFWEEHPAGIVFGAAFTDDLHVAHIAVTKEQGIDRLHSSKYVQSDLTGVYHEIGRLLASDQYVLFSGTPCQAAAVRKLYGHQEHLFVLDIVCNGVASPLVFERYLEELSRNSESVPVAYNFRNKRYEKARGMACEFRNGMVLERLHAQDRFCKMYMSYMLSRPACYQCAFTTPNRDSDITLGDFHGLNEVDPTFSEENCSLVIAHSEAGERMLTRISASGEMREYPIEKCLQPRLQSPAKAHLLRKVILRDYLHLDKALFEKKFGAMLPKCGPKE